MCRSSISFSWNDEGGGRYVGLGFLVMGERVVEERKLGVGVDMQGASCLLE